MTHYSKRLAKVLSNYVWREQHKDSKNEIGFLQAKNGMGIVPYINNFIFFNEADIHAGKHLEDKLEKLSNSMIAQMKDYKRFILHKKERPLVDIYAGFKPFNEAMKSFFPFVKSLRKVVRKGDVILNLWDRTGWTTTLLSGLFPDQQILTTWDGNKDVLGYRGYKFWMDKKR